MSSNAYSNSLASATVSSSTGVLIVLVLSAAFAALFFAGYALLVGDDGTSGKRSYSQVRA